MIDPGPADQWGADKNQNRTQPRKKHILYHTYIVQITHTEHQNK